MDNLTHETVVDFVIDSLRTGIQTGRLAPGQRLIVSDLTRTLSVSAGPVREAIRRLTGDGLVEIVPHRGAAVREISPNDVREIYQLRELIEGLAARLAAERSTAGPFQDRLRALMADMRRVAARESMDDFLENNQRFHELIHDASGSERVRASASQLMLPIYRFRLPYRMSIADLHKASADHELIASAILKGDPGTAEAAMREHVRTAGQNLLKTIEPDMLGGSRRS